MNNKSYIPAVNVESFPRPNLCSDAKSKGVIYEAQEEGVSMPSYPMRTYRLKFSGDSGPPREIEFEASAPDAALSRCQDLCGGREVQLFEDGAKLASLRLAPVGSYWIVS